MDELIHKVKEYITEFLHDAEEKGYTFHNLDHTMGVFRAASILGKEAELADEDLQILRLAALFHDAGYLAQPENHEIESARIADKYLKKEGVPKMQIDCIKGLILATKLGREPKTELEKLIKDSDFRHLGDSNYKTFLDALKREWKLNVNTEKERRDWLISNIDFLRCHKYYHEAANKLWNQNKKKNLMKLEDELSESASEPVGEVQEAAALEVAASEPTKKSKKKNKAKAKDNSPGRGVDTIFRVTLRNHVALSQIADNKANIMLSINAILLSIIMSFVLPNMEAAREFFLPLSLMVGTCVLTIVSATISTMPKVTSGIVTKDLILQKKANLLFFGNFHNMKLEDYQWGMEQLMSDRDYLYSALAQDLFYLGVVLSKKYRFLRWTYTVFVVGIVVSMLSFMVMVLMSES